MLGATRPRSVWAFALFLAIFIDLYEVGVTDPGRESLAALLHCPRRQPEPDRWSREFERRFRIWEEQTPLLVPMVGMLNFAEEGNVEVVQTDEAIIIKATKPIEAGGELVVRPGAGVIGLPKVEMAARYGYLEDANRHEEVYIPAEQIVEMAMESGGPEEETRSVVVSTL